MKRVIGIGFSIPSKAEDYIKLDSTSSLSETDIAIFSPNFFETSYSTYNSSSYPSNETYEGKKLYNKESSVNILDHAKHWKNELSNFVENGGTLVVVLCKKEDFFIYTGTKDISGTGRNQKVTNHVAPFTNYNFLPFTSIEFNIASGKTVIPNGSLMLDFYKNFKDYLSFEIYLKSDKISNSIFTTKNKDRILGANLRAKNGHILFIPFLNLENEKFIRYDSKTDKNSWNTEGLKVGKILINNLVEIDNAIRKNQEKTPRPAWLTSNEYNLVASEKTVKLIDKNKKEIEIRQKENINLQSVLEEQESLKDLLFETGKPLENSVIKALKILGYKAENYNDGELELDQVITSPEGHRLIGECEGKDNKDIDVSKFRQLLDALNADFEREEIAEKAYGILFGNPQRLTNPTERTLSFTKKCQAGAEREKFALIKTEDLFKISKYVVENKDLEFAKECRQTIISQLGRIIEFPSIK